MNDQTLLNKKIEFLKSNIQEILDKSSDETDANILESLSFQKQQFLAELEVAMNELRTQKEKSKLENEYKKVLRMTGSMEYHRIKNKSNSTELLANLKEKREKAQNDYEKMQVIEQEYNEQEISLCNDIPGFLFFHKDITDNYGNCPHIELIDGIREKRLNWLDDQDDNGQLYRYLYDKFILKVEYEVLIQQRIELENYFSNIHCDYLTESQQQLLDIMENDIQEYINSPIKTKKLKDKFKIIVNNLSSLVIETDLNINDYLSAFYKLYIPINLPNKQDGISTNTIVSKNGELMSNLYKDKVEEYKGLLEKIEVSQRYLKNTINNLKTELYQYLYNLKYIKKKTNTISQHGKYYKKWSELTDEEKLDRYYSYIDYYISKSLVEPGLIEGENIEKMKETVRNLISENTKRIKFKDIKWNVKRGTIEQINCLRFNEEKMDFYITKEVIKEPKPKTKKCSSVRSILTKESEKVINEEMVLFMIQVKKKKKLNLDNLKTLKDEFIEKMKLKLKCKRITVNDKIEIFKKFDEIYSVIANNDSSSNC